MISRRGNIKDSIEIRRLPGGSQNSRYAAFQLANLVGHSVVRGVRQSGVEIA